MLSDEILLSKAKELIESKISWGDSKEWTNQDFVALSEKIQEQINVSLSHVTLKRIWGKVKYDSLPNTHTLNTLVQFVGYENWRAFKIKNGNIMPVSSGVSLAQETKRASLLSEGRSRMYKTIDVLAVIVILTGCIFTFIQAAKFKLNLEDYSFSSKKAISTGVPNSVIFDYDATKAPTDIVIIQQSWDSKLRTRVPKDQRQHTSIYYFPDFYKAKLIIGNEIVKEHELFIKSDGWLTAVDVSPVPVYFKKEDAIANGKLSLSVEKIELQNIKLQPDIRTTLYGNVQDFGEIYTDQFIFETSLKNDYREGSSACQKTNIFLLADDAVTGIPLCAKGCVSDIDFYFSGIHLSGKKKDLSAFGTDFSDFVKVRIESENGKGKIFLDNVLTYEVNAGKRAKIIGIYFLFEGTGSVDYVKLQSDKVIFEDQFDETPSTIQ